MDILAKLRDFSLVSARVLICGALLVACGGEGEPAPHDASPFVEPDASMRPDGAPDLISDAATPVPDAGGPVSDAGGPASDAGGPDAAPEMLECSNESRWGLGGDDWCPNAVGELTTGGSEADCPAAPLGWRANHLSLGPTIVYCVYEAEPLVRLPDFCTLPRSPTGAPAWEWLSPDCVSVGGS